MDIFRLQSVKHQNKPKSDTQTSPKNAHQTTDIEPILTQRGAYEKIFSEQREDKKGGLFELYVRQTTHSPTSTKTHDAVKQAIEQGNLLFIDTTHQNMGNSNLSKTTPDENSFASQKYLIRENKVLRFANELECKQLDKLDEIILDQKIGYAIMQDSYTTEIMAAHHNIIPPRSSDVYNKIFSNSGSFFEIYHIENGARQQENFHQLVEESMRDYKFLFMMEASILTKFVPTKDKFLNKTYLIRETYILRFPTDKEIRQLEDITKTQKLKEVMLLSNKAQANKLRIKDDTVIKEAEKGIDTLYKKLIKDQFKQIQQEACGKLNTQGNLFSSQTPYELIFERNPSKHDIFQIYYRNIEKKGSSTYLREYYNEITDLVKDTQNLMFIAMGPNDQSCTISKDLPPMKEFGRENYLIREQNTLRFATKKENTILNEQLGEFKDKHLVERKISTMQLIMRKSNTQSEKTSPKVYKTV